MTIGIGVLCEDGKAAVLAADRIVSKELGSIPDASGTPRDRRMVFTGPEPKIARVHPQAFVTLAGNEFGLSALTRLQEAARACSSFSDTAAMVLDVRHQLLREKVEHRILRPEFSLSFEEFRQQEDGLNPEVAKDVRRRIANLNDAMAEFLLAGVDADGAHLLFVARNGEPMDCDGVGYRSIGAGGLFADLALMADGQFTKTWGLAEAVYRVYHARRASQLSGLADRVVDMAVARAGQGAWPVEPDGIDRLEEIYQGRQRLSAKHENAICKAILPHR